MADSSKLYNTGFVYVAVKEHDPNRFSWLYEIHEKCKRLIVGIADPYIMARIYGEGIGYDVNAVQHFLNEHFGFIDEFVVLGPDELDYVKLYERFRFDACFYGSRYGTRWNSDAAFLKEHNVAFISMIPDNLGGVTGIEAMKLCVDNIRREHKVILFGTGKYYDIYRERYGASHGIAYAVDTNVDKWNTAKNGVDIFSPDKLQEENANDSVIVICARDYQSVMENPVLEGLNCHLMLYRNEIAVLEEFSLVRRSENTYMATAHKVLSKMMRDFDRLCMKHHIHYYVICGSLIGTLRHQGHIPWDDDVDIAIPRRDYNRLKRIIPKEWKDDTYQFVDYNGLGNDAFLDFMPRIIYMKEKLPTKVFDKVRGKATADVDDRLFLDLYVMDNAFDNDKLHNFCMFAMKGIYNLCMGHRAYVDYNEYLAVYPELAVKKLKAVHTIGRMLPLRFLTFWYQAFSQVANFFPTKNYFMDSCAITVIERRFSKRFFKRMVRRKFEDFTISTPYDADGLFRCMGYGGVEAIMQYPPLSIRKPSHYFNSDIEIY